MQPQRTRRPAPLSAVVRCCLSGDFQVRCFSVFTVLQLALAGLLFCLEFQRISTRLFCEVRLSGSCDLKSNSSLWSFSNKQDGVVVSRSAAFTGAAPCDSARIIAVRCPLWSMAWEKKWSPVMRCCQICHTSQGRHEAQPGSPPFLRATCLVMPEVASSRASGLRSSQAIAPRDDTNPEAPGRHRCFSPEPFHCQNGGLVLTSARHPTMTTPPSNSRRRARTASTLPA